MTAQGAPPAEVGALDRGTAHRRHLAAALLDLGARGHLRVTARRPGVDGGAPWVWRAHVASRPVWSDDGALRPHEVRLLDVLAGDDDGGLGVVLNDGAVRALLAAVRRDAAERGWLLTRHRRPTWLPRRTSAGRALLGQVQAERQRLRSVMADRGRRGGPTDAGMLAKSVALGVTVPWEEMQRRRVPVPPWFTPGHRFGEHGWMGLQSLVLAVSTTSGGSWGVPYLDLGGIDVPC